MIDEINNKEINNKKNEGVQKKLKGLDTTKYRFCVKCGKILPLCHFEISSTNKKGTKFYRETCKRCEQNKQIKPVVPEKIKYLDSKGNVKVIESEDITENNSPINVKLINVFETFVPIEGTNNYWMSNYGRVVNNLRNPFKFHVHNMTDHYTINVFDIDGSVIKEDYRTEKLVAKIFLKNPNKYSKVWFLDGNRSNYYYKNLVYVSNKDYNDLMYNGKTINEIEIKQEYYEYPNKARSKAYAVFIGIYNRCYNREGTNYHDCYEGTTICQEWLDNPELFVDWYLEHYYSVKNELMAVDKDLFGNGSMMYSPKTCCIVPQTINTMMSNSKKHNNPNLTIASELPLGVRFDASKNVYYGEITPFGHDETVPLSEWNTPEEAFEEYKNIKEMDICMMAIKYKNYLPEDVFNALMQYEVKPF